KPNHLRRTWALYRAFFTGFLHELRPLPGERDRVWPRPGQPFEKGTPKLPEGGIGQRLRLSETAVAQTNHAVDEGYVFNPLCPQQFGQELGGERRERDHLATGHDGCQLTLRLVANKDQDRPRRRLLQRFEKTVARLLIQVFGVIENGHLISAPCGFQTQPVTE